jgi:hypothetical protein
MMMHRERMVRNGIRAMAIQPTFCLQNPEACFGDETEDEEDKARLHFF